MKLVKSTENFSKIYEELFLDSLQIIHFSKMFSIAKNGMHFFLERPH